MGHPLGPRWTGPELAANGQWLFAPALGIQELIIQKRWDEVGVKNLLTNLKRVLDEETGVVLIRGIHGPEERQRQFMLEMADAVGIPLTNGGVLVHVVTATEEPIKNGFKLISKTRETTGFHTDGTGYEKKFPDIVMMMMVQPAMVGGESRITNALSVYDQLAAAPNLLSCLARDFFQDIVVEMSPGGEVIHTRESCTLPIFAFDRWRSGASFKFHLGWIASSHDRVGKPFSKEQREAIDALIATMEHSNNHLNLKLSSGDLLICNNHIVAHDRTAYQDPPLPEPARRLLRMWVSCTNY